MSCRHPYQFLWPLSSDTLISLFFLFIVQSLVRPSWCSLLGAAFLVWPSSCDLLGVAFLVWPSWCSLLCVVKSLRFFLIVIQNFCFWGAPPQRKSRNDDNSYGGSCHLISHFQFWISQPPMLYVCFDVFYKIRVRWMQNVLLSKKWRGTWQKSFLFFGIINTTWRL